MGRVVQQIAELGRDLIRVLPSRTLAHDLEKMPLIGRVPRWQVLIGEDGARHRILGSRTIKPPMTSSAEELSESTCMPTSAASGTSDFFSLMIAAVTASSLSGLSGTSLLTSRRARKRCSASIPAGAIRLSMASPNPTAL